MKRSAARFFWRLTKRLVFLTILAAVGLATYAATVGIPERVSVWAIQRADPGRYTLESGPIRWHPLRGFLAEDVKLYRKRMVGPPAVEAARVELRLSPLSLLGDGPATGRIRAQGGLIRPAMLIGGEPDLAPYEPGAAMRKGIVCYVHVADAEADGVRLRDVRFRVEAADTRVNVRDIRADLEDDRRVGAVRTGSAEYDLSTRGLVLSGETWLDPLMLMPLVELVRLDTLAELARDFVFAKEPPRCEVVVRARLKEGETVFVTARFETREGRFRDVAVLRADGTVRVEADRNRQIVEVRPLFVVRPEGIGTGGFTVDTGGKTVEFDIASTLNPHALARMIGFAREDVFDRIRFDGQANVAARGEIHYGNMDASLMDMTVSGREGRLGPLALDDFGFSLRMTGRTNALDNFRARLYRGSLAGSLVLTLPPVGADPAAPPAYAVSLRLDNLDFDRLAAAVNPDKVHEYDGQFSLALDLEGEVGPDAPNRARGEGRLRIKEGRVLLLPIFGGLTEMLSKYIPGIDFLARQDSARADFTVADGKLHAENAAIEGNIFRLWGRGDYGLDGALDFRVQVRFLRERTLLGRLLDVPTWIFSKFFEFQLKGTVREPDWTPFGPTMDLLRKIGLRK